MPASKKVKSEIKQSRKIIDSLNQEILLALLKRLEVIDQIAAVKKKNHLPSYDREREAQMMKSLLTATKNRQKQQVIKKVFKAVFATNLSYLKKSVKKF